MPPAQRGNKGYLNTCMKMSLFSEAPQTTTKPRLPDLMRCMSTMQNRPKKEHSKNMKSLFSVVSGAALWQLLLNLVLLSLLILETVFSFRHLQGQGIRKVQKNHLCMNPLFLPFVSRADPVSI